MVTRRLGCVGTKQSITTVTLRVRAVPFQSLAKTLKCLAMRYRIFSFPCALLLLVLAGSVHADGRWRDLPPEERQELREQMREQWQNRRERAQERPYRGHGEALPPEERQRLRDEMRQQQRLYPERERRHRRD